MITSITSRLAGLTDLANNGAIGIALLYALMLLTACVGGAIGWAIVMLLFALGVDALTHEQLGLFWIGCMSLGVVLTLSSGCMLSISARMPREQGQDSREITAYRLGFSGIFVIFVAYIWLLLYTVALVSA